ncbi:MAG: L,D-transpeptidase family protein [Janthinobacterium lividum]
MNLRQNVLKILSGFALAFTLTTQSFCWAEKISQHSYAPHTLKQSSISPENMPSKKEHSPLSDAQKKDQFYQSRSQAPIWLDSNGLTDAGQNALLTLQNAGYEGLSSSLYQPIIKMMSDLDVKGMSAQELMTWDIKITQSITTYLEDLEGERLSPEKVNKDLHLKVKDVDPYVILTQGLDQDPSGKWLTTYTLVGKEYQDLKKLLAEYRHIEQQGGWPTLEMPSSTKLELGKHHPSIMALKKQLFIQGDLKEEDTGDDTFTKNLMSALQQFQRRHGLEDDGKLGPETQQALNVSVEARIQQIIVSMERWRWAPNKGPGERSVVVNIAGFYLQAFEGNQKVFDMPVIIGRSFRKTPVFVSQIDFVRFNPSWHVPQSIAVKDKLPLLRSKPSYFKTKGYTIYDSSGSPVDPEDVDWAGVEAANFNYKIVQKPGDANALGKLFFHINTPFDVFLHGTPDVELFKKAKRSFSSGCIRLQDPTKVAEFILKDDPKWSKEAILARLDQTGTQDVISHPLVDVYVTYQTVWVDDENLAHFMDDLYGQDKTIETALKIQEASKVIF